MAEYHKQKIIYLSNDTEWEKVKMDLYISVVDTSSMEISSIKFTVNYIERWFIVRVFSNDS